MNYYLVDFENVKIEDIKDLAEIKEGDELAIFYSDRCKTIKLDLIESILKNNIKLSCYKIKNGTKNALDFQLASHLGYLIGTGDYSNIKYYIVSNDKGFDCLCDYWKQNNKSVNRIELVKIAEKIVNVLTPQTFDHEEESKVEKNNLATIDEMSKLLSKEDEPKIILEIFNEYKTKQEICNELSRKFKDSKKASCIYKKLKPLLIEKNKS